MPVEEIQAVIQGPLKCGIMGKLLTDDGLLGDGVMGSLNDGAVGGAPLASEADLDS
jgi:hypothetical protein